MRRTSLALSLALILASGSLAATYTVPTHGTLQAVVAGTVNGDEVIILNGPYTLTSTLNINSAITISGESETGVVISIDCGSGYGIHPAVGGITLEDFTLNIPTVPASTQSGFIIHASGTPNVQNGLTIRRVTIQGSGTAAQRRAGIDIHGYDNVVLEDVTSNDSTYGNGIQLTGCHHVRVDNCSTTNNAWGSLAIYCSQYLTPPRACDDVQVYANCTFNEGNTFVENEFGLTSTGVVFDGYEYILRNDEFRAGAAGFIFYQDTLADAQAFAAFVFAGFEDATSFEEILTGDFVTFPGMSIQAAIDAADPGDIIDVGAGAYYEILSVNKGVTLSGAGTATYDGIGDWSGGTLITRDPNVGGQATNQVVHVTAADVTLGALTVDGRYGFDQGTGQTTNYGIMVEGVSGVTLDDLHVLDSTNNGIELNNADSATLTDVLCERTAFAPAYYASFQDGLRCVASDDLDVDGFTAVNVKRGVVVFQGYNSGVIENLSVTGNGDADGYGVGFYTSPTPGWWQPAFGDYEGDLTFTFEGSHLYTGVDYGIYVSDELMDKDITLSVDPAAVFDFFGVTSSGGWRLGSGSVPDLDNVMSEMGLTLKTSGPPDLYNYAPTTAWVDDDYCDVCANDGHVWGYDAYDNIQDGIDAVSGSTVYVAAGNYVEALLIEKSVNLYGATAGDSKNGYTVPAGYAWDPAFESIITHPDPAGGYTAIVDIHDTSDVTFDGFVVGELNAVGNANTSLVRVYAHTQAITNINVVNCVIGPNTNTTAQDGAQGRMGLYIVNHPYGTDGVENSTFAHNKIFDCKGNGDNIFLWTSYYAYGAAGPADMTGTVIDDNEIYGSHRSGIETAGGFQYLTISNNTIYGNSQLPGDDPDFLKYGHGIQLIRGSSDKVSDPLTAYGPVDLLIIGNEIYGNSKCGVYMGPKNDSITFTDNVIHDNGWNGVMVDLAGNYWNPQFESPPVSEQYACYDCSTDISGTGNEIYDNGTSGNPIADYGVTVNGTPTNSFEFEAADNWWGTASGPYHPSLNASGTGNPVSDHVVFEPWIGMADVAALPAASGPINCGETVTLDIHYTPKAMTPELRGFTVTVACSAELTFGAGDIADLNVLGAYGPDYFYVIDNLDGTFTIDSAILGGSTGLDVEADLFRVTFHPAGDGVGTVTLSDVEFRDMDNGGIGASIDGATITVDCTAPPGVTGLASAPGHEKVTLDWTMADATDVDHYEIWRAVWNLGSGQETVSAYPEYDDDNPTEPIWPADHAAADASLEWVKLTTVPDPLPGTAVGYVDNHAPRGIYYYEVYAVDAAGNIGPGAGPMNRATNYWLGDVEMPYDGTVGVPDIDELASTYGWGTGDGGYKPEVDVGPTDTNDGFGIPATDSEVDFEDLMIFALNYGNVAPRQPVGGTEEPILVWQRIDATTWALVLSEPCADLKGLHLRAPLPDGVTCEVFAGDLLDEQPGLGFAANAPDRGLDAGVALMGRGAVICGQGELVRVSFSGDVTTSPLVTARDGSNGDLEISLTTEAEPLTPLRFAAHPNFPNPFNPLTKIAFDLPEGRAVRVAVYALDGSLVKTLIDSELPAGSHEVVWDGRDERRQNVASGTYFYRIDAGTDSQVHKMMLMK